MSTEKESTSLLLKKGRFQGTNLIMKLLHNLRFEGRVCLPPRKDELRQCIPVTTDNSLALLLGNLSRRHFDLSWMTSDGPTAMACARARFRRQNTFGSSCNLNGTNEKTPESHDCMRQFRLRSTVQELPVRQKLSNASEDCKLRRNRQQSRRAGETSQENQQLRLQRRHEQKRARVERETPGQLSQEVKHKKWRKSRIKGKKDRVLEKPATSSSETTWAQTSKGWTRDHGSHVRV